MVVVNDLPSCTHTVQIMWFYDNGLYEVTSVAEHDKVVVPDNGGGGGGTTTSCTAPCRGVLFANNMFTCALDERFCAKCRDNGNVYTLLSSALFPNNLPPPPPPPPTLPAAAPRPQLKNVEQRRFYVLAAAASTGFLAAIGLYAVGTYVLFHK